MKRIFVCSYIEGKVRGAFIYAVIVMSSYLDNNFMSTRTVQGLELIPRKLNLLSANCAIFLWHVVCLLLSHDILYAYPHAELPYDLVLQHMLEEHFHIVLLLKDSRIPEIHSKSALLL